ncbi:hypothetical protein TRFO_05552 [Tritrichomonas foetus]|uniref:Uncharacterized protein n=1 Tax=Tritrichomonas foetus TaxID=1144522 RepID=A0A1J4KA88_9EUKA|nr:hypothetical protein TRFO_05552 [Tritrichomonas foetus]|eukprot:OHT06365.1 hypothetical protein TRFO_05552 [Tritrichomonas foetus]
MNRQTKMISLFLFPVMTEQLQTLSKTPFETDQAAIDFLKILLPALDQDMQNQGLYQIGVDAFKNNAGNTILKSHFLETVFSGEDHNVAHYYFARKLLKENLITIEEVHQRIECLTTKDVKPPVGPDFKLLILATPLLFFEKEINATSPDDFKKYYSQVSTIFRSSPMIKRMALEWNTPLNIRNCCYDLMSGNITFEPDNLEKLVEIAGDPAKLPQIPVY